MRRLLITTALATCCAMPVHAEPSHADRVTACQTLIGKMHYPENLEAICARDKAKCQKLVDEWAHWIKAAKPECERSITEQEAKASEPAHALTCTTDMAKHYPGACSQQVEMRPVQCLVFAEGDAVTISGYVVKARQPYEIEGVPPRDYYEITLDKPLCDGDVEPQYTQQINVEPKMLGHHVEVTGRMETFEAGSNINHESVRDLDAEEAK